MANVPPTNFVHCREGFDVGTCIAANGSPLSSPFNFEAVPIETELYGPARATGLLKPDGQPITEVAKSINSNLEVNLMTSMSNRFESTLATASASVNRWGATASARLDYASKVGSKGNDVSLHISSYAVLSYKQQKNFDQLVLSENAKTSIIKNKMTLQEFEAAYGVYVVDAVEYAVTFDANYQFACTSKEQNREVAASLSAGYKGLFNANAKFQAAIEDASTQSNASFSVKTAGQTRERPLPGDIDTIIASARSITLDTQPGVPFRCHMRRLRDFVCVKEAFAAAGTITAKQQHPLAEEYYKVYEFIMFNNKWLDETITAHPEIKKEITSFTSMFDPEIVLPKYPDTDMYKDMCKKAKEIVEMLEATDALLYDTEPVNPPTIEEDVTYSITNVTSGQTLKVKMYESATPKYYVIQKADKNEFLDSGGAGYWYGGAAGGHNDVRTNDWSKFTFIPYGNKYLIVQYPKSSAPKFLVSLDPRFTPGFALGDKGEQVRAALWKLNKIHRVVAS